MKKLKEKISENLIILIGILILIVGLLIIGIRYIPDVKTGIDEEKAIEEYYEEDTDEKEIEKEDDVSDKISYIAILKIPSINLIRGLVSPNSKMNDVKYNIQIIDESDMPDVVGGNLILAAHAGNSNISYFKNLNKLNLGDSITIDYSNKTYRYEVVNIYEVEKTGTVSIGRDTTKTTLTLITCKHNTNYQIVVIAELNSVE